MKKNLLIIGLTMAGATGAFAQGNLNFENISPGNAVSHIYGPETQNASLELSGNVSQAYGNSTHTGEFPVGTQVYDGGLVGGESTGTGTYQQQNGTLYSVELAAVPGSGASSVGTANFIPLSLTSVESAHATKGISGNAGFFSAGTVAVPGADGVNITTITARVFAWYNGGGANLTYAQDVASGAPAGFSALFNATVSDPNNGSVSPPIITGLTSFNLTETTTTPEPSTIVLGVIGASSFLFRRRK